MTKNYVKFLQIPLFFVFLLVLPSKIYAQCAGSDAFFQVCDTPDPASKTISLFNLLGSATPGGIWTDDNGSGGLNTATGVLNVQEIRNSRIYRYTYKIEGISGCTDNSSTVTVVVGGYAGVPSNISVCDDDKDFTLFQAFDGKFLSPHENGRWHDDTNNEYVDAAYPVKGKIGVYQFTYTMPQIGTCTEKTATVFVKIYRAPKAGTTKDLLLCGSDGLAAYADFDLYSLITDHDLGGKWNGPDVTSADDHNVNLEQLFETYGEGEFQYVYTVTPLDNKICPSKSVSAIIRIEKRLDFSDAKLVVESDICEDRIADAVYSAKITQGTSVIPNGTYNIDFRVSGPNGGSESVAANFVNGEIRFPIKSAYFKQVGTFTIAITNIVAVTSKKACTNIIGNLTYDLKINPLPRLDGALLTTTPTCQNKKAFAQISNAAQLADGNYEIIYNITGDNFALGQTAAIIVAGGKSQFEIPAGLNVKSGVSQLVIVRITKLNTGCTKIANVAGNLTINPLPVAITVKVLANDKCFNEPVPVAVSGLGNLTAATLSYMLSDSNSSTLQTVVLNVVNGNADFFIPVNLLANTGTTVISASNLMNNTTLCDVSLNNVSDGFFVNPIPSAPTVNNLQTFCKVDDATITNLSPRGAQYKWYISQTAATPLADTYVLKTENLYVRETSSANCTSAPTAVSIVVNDTPAPVLNSGGADFCGLKNPTISDLSKATNVSSTVTWYDAKENGNLLKSTTLLVHNAVYYGYDLSTITDCISDNYLEVAVSLKDCDASEFDFFIPDGFSPNGDNVNDTFRIPDIEFLYPDYSLEIFNRYGNVMFKGNINKPNWDGRNSESAGFGDGIAANGVYFYIINFNKDNKPPKQGCLYLNR
ncbi:gliding motility-associated C-terminal domain-containing protein [Flavobacterium oncorhynchi]|uniref:gliding motility-associated C-terminal domain-containing protein n=1 Tax=Flavobacterium oncorhynchi TaxID=728056 RepID=UPI00351A7EF4